MRDSQRAGAVCFSGCSLLISQPVAWHLSSPPPDASSPPLFLENKHAHGFLTWPYASTYRPDAGRFPPSMGSSLILQQLQGRTYVSQTRWQLQTDCVTALSNCLSREKRHSSTPLACFVFADVTVTISPSIVTGESGENCAVMMIGDIDLVFGSPRRDMPQSLDDCCP